MAGNWMIRRVEYILYFLSGFNILAIDDLALKEKSFFFPLIFCCLFFTIAG
jgi:hypothetical protein